jgi:phospholipase A1
LSFKEVTLVLKQHLKALLLLISAFYSIQIFADPADTKAGSVEEPVVKQLDQPNWISLYEPTYVLPFYYTDKPYYSAYDNNTPNQQRIQKLEVNFQISFKVPIWRINPDHEIDAAYTQISFWQAYNNSPFFRETDYQPELYLQNKLDLPIAEGWRLKFLNAGIEHESNGRGGQLERSWNRVFADGIVANENWMISIRPWYVLHDQAIHTHNTDISNYLGYGRELLTYKYKNQEFSLQTRNVVESLFKRGAVQFNWSFPLTSHLKGYVKCFSGYGQSLLEYNHYTNAAGIGIAVNDWI